MRIIAIIGATAAAIGAALFIAHKVTRAKGGSSEGNDTDADLTVSGPDAGMSLGKGEFTQVHNFKGTEIDV